MSAGKLACVLFSALAPSLAWGSELGGHVGLAAPMVALKAGKMTTFGQDPTLAFPMGITVHKSDAVAFDLELVPAVHARPQAVELTIHPGLLFHVAGFTAGGRVAFEPASGAYGVTPLLARGLGVGESTLFLEVDLPVRLRDATLSAGLALHLGVGF